MIVLAIENNEPQFNKTLKDSPAAVAQCVMTKLALWLSEWYLNLADGTDWLGSVIGVGTPADLTIQERILQTPGVVEITSYSSTIVNRTFTVEATILTVYSVTPQAIAFTQNIG